jgi:hypothetical protein
LNRMTMLFPPAHPVRSFRASPVKLLEIAANSPRKDGP